MPKFITLLNNCKASRLQISAFMLTARGDTSVLSYQESVVGPSDRAEWTVVCKVSGEIKGIGVASSKSAAKETAAKQALQVLWVPYKGVVSGMYIFEPLIKDATSQSQTKAQGFPDPVIVQVDAVSDHKSATPSNNSEK
ncbi:hypothetical protein ARMSODRAFT_969263 [Armillaria solidipes]|uniref:DRBM domain-containing protein n=1 Tax=Armillaria solidipes TaxID=1076256 RepID=A0A2H3CMQ1_9AGAR|nr:hypothetical protein ARMSODRAFT_969263 [Armillaria solidipes]